MSCRDDLELCVAAGETFTAVFRWGTSVLVSKPITSISNATPAVITAAAHGMVTGWRAAVISAGGMRQINSGHYPPHERDWHPVTVLTSSTVSLDDVSSSGFAAYTSGGFLVYSTPVSLIGASAVMKIRDYPVTGAVLATLIDTGISPAIVLDNTTKTITVSFATAALTWTVGYFDLEMTDATGAIYQIAQGVIPIE